MVLLSCCYQNTPPGIKTVQSQMDENINDIQSVVDFLKKSDYEKIYITNADGTMNADFKNEQIADINVCLAVNHLFQDNQYLKICKDGNTVYLLQWKGLRDIGCGIAYTINGVDIPVIAYSTELLPLSNDGWFYYISDYELWKSKQT